mgnify:CR=1 FL=1
MMFNILVIDPFEGWIRSVGRLAGRQLGERDDLRKLLRARHGAQVARGKLCRGTYSAVRTNAYRRWWSHAREWQS